ncbi:MAG: hypothetical protein IBJ00_01285 [Alphaproteobacteria bacterium]|nr:hypothetical protein [Alphaproteobacteria bacterium]
MCAQFTRIRFLGKDLADPILSYLNLPYLKGAPRNISLISKWTRILTQIDAYEKQSPSNSISILEHFLMFDLNQINENMCVDAVLSYDIYEKTGDYFLDRRNKIRRAMIHRCESIARHSSIANYNELAEFFNRYLAGRFPFSKESEFYGTNEANVDDVNTFLVLFNKINESQRKALDGLIDSPNLHSSPSQFLRQIDLLKPILSAALNANADQYVPKVDFAVDFRTDRNQETEGNKIIDWNLQINDNDIDFRDDKRAGQWVVGDPLCVILRWAADGPTSPTLDEHQPNLTISNHTARFSYEGRWSLIRLLKAHAIDYKTYEKGKPTPVTLQFMVPTHYKNAAPDQSSQKTTTAKVFLRFSLFDPTKKTSPATVVEKTKTEADLAPPVMMDKDLLPLPIFPFKAPTIETRVQSQKNKSFMSYP